MAIPQQEPARHPPSSEYTLGGKIPVIYYYIDDRCDDNQAVFTKEMIDEQIRMLPEVLQKEKTVSCLVQALKKYKTDGMGTLIVGSRIPFYEGVCISLGISPTTVDYNKVMSYDDRVRSISMVDLESDKKHDSAISISSYEHSGLGRYGDPLDPFGDTKSMTALKRYVKKDALLFLSIPVGQDALVWRLELVALLANEGRKASCRVRGRR